MAEDGKRRFRLPEITPRGMRWALVLSVVLNLVLGGVIIGAAFHGKPPGPPGDVIVRMVRALPPEIRQDMRRDWVRRQDERHQDERHQDGHERQARPDRMSSLRAVIGAVAADPFDPSALDREMALFQQGSDAALGSLRGELVSRIAGMTPDQRAAYAEALRGDGRDGRESHGGGRGRH